MSWDGIDWLIAGAVVLYLASVAVLAVCIRRAAPEADEHENIEQGRG